MFAPPPKIWLISIEINGVEWYLFDMDIDTVGFKYRTWTKKRGKAWRFEQESHAEIHALMALEGERVYKVKEYASWSIAAP